MLRKWWTLMLGLTLASPTLAAKPPLCGLVNMGRPAAVAAGATPDTSLAELRAHPGTYSGVVLLARWAELEPARGRFDFAVIDQGLRSVAAYNAAHRDRPVRAKLRVFAGPSAPSWALAIGGPPITVDARHGGPRPLGRFWTPEYRAAWRELQDALARRYDTDPLLGEVAISSCSSKSGEPFILSTTPDGIAALEAAGFSDAAYRACLAGAVDDYAAWRETPLDYTFNPFRNLAGGRTRVDLAFTLGVMHDFRTRLGPRAVLANHGLRADTAPNAATMLDEMRRLGPPIEFQVITPKMDVATALRKGQAIGATEVELWDTAAADGPVDATATDLATWQSGFACRVR